MPRVPEPDQTPDGPRFEGRPLDRPGDELVDQGARFDVRTLLTRRGMLALVGLGAGTATLAACSATATATGTTAATASPSATGTPSATPAPASTSASGVSSATEEIPDETNGPYPADGTNSVNVLERSGIVRSDITASLDGGTTVDGVPLTMTFKVTDMVNANAAFAGAAVYVWHCDAQGRYSMYSSGVEGETYLRGIQVADADGEVTFRTIVPGCYQGRWTHIHFEVYPDLDSATSVGSAISTSQLAFPADMLSGIYALGSYSGSAANLAGVGTRISDDDIFGDGDWELQVPAVAGGISDGYTATLAVAVDTSTTPVVTTGGGPGGGPGR